MDDTCTGGDGAGERLCWIVRIDDIHRNRAVVGLVAVAELTVSVLTPAHRGSIRGSRTRVHTAAIDVCQSGERLLRILRIDHHSGNGVGEHASGFSVAELTDVVPAPTQSGGVGCDRTGVETPETDIDHPGERFVGVGRVDDGGGSAAGVTRSAQLTSEVVPPAVHQRVFGQGAGVDLSGTDLHYPDEVAIVSNGRHHSTGDVVALEDLVAQTETATSVEAPAIGGPVFGHHAGVGRLGVDVDGSRQERILLVRVNYLNRAVAVGECSVT